MKRQFRLIDQFADLVVGADDPWRLAVKTLEMVMSLTNGRSGAVFTHEGDRMTLFASRGIDQHVLDAVETAWNRNRDGFLHGETLYVPDRDHDTRLGRAPALPEGCQEDDADRQNEGHPRQRCLPSPSISSTR